METLTDQQRGEYRAICLFEGQTTERRDLQRDMQHSTNKQANDKLFVKTHFYGNNLSMPLKERKYYQNI